MPSQLSVLSNQARQLAQILLYGSVGTASTAVVYLLHEQIHQVRQWRHMIDNGRRLGEAARKHGFSEAAIQRLTDISLESFILDQQSRGKLRLELVKDPPKSTSSPH